MNRKLFFALSLSAVIVGCLPSNDIEVMALNQRIGELEQQLDSYRNAQHYSAAVTHFCEQNRQASKVPLPTPDIDVDPELLDWYYAQPMPDYDQRMFIKVQGDDNAFTIKAREDPKKYIELIALIDYENPIASMTLSEILTPEYYPLLLPHLKTSIALATLAYEKGLHRQYEKEFAEAFQYWNSLELSFIPNGLVLAAIEMEDPGLFESIRNYAIYGIGRDQVFSLLEGYGTYNLDKLALTAWDKLRYDSGTHNIIEVAFVAAKYAGSQDALFELATQWKIAEGEDKNILREELTEIISLPSFKSFEDDVVRLEYQPSMKKWYLPS